MGLLTSGTPARIAIDPVVVPTCLSPAVFVEFFTGMPEKAQWKMLCMRNENGLAALDMAGQTFVKSFLLNNTTELRTQKVCTQDGCKRVLYTFRLLSLFLS